MRIYLKQISYALVWFKLSLSTIILYSFRVNSSRRGYQMRTEPKIVREYEPYPFKTTTLHHVNIEPVSEDIIAFYPCEYISTINLLSGKFISNM